MIINYRYSPVLSRSADVSNVSLIGTVNLGSDDNGE